jgi:hypothetical protein
MASGPSSIVGCLQTDFFAIYSEEQMVLLFQT